MQFSVSGKLSIKFHVLIKQKYRASVDPRDLSVRKSRRRECHYFSILWSARKIKALTSHYQLNKVAIGLVRIREQNTYYCYNVTVLEHFLPVYISKVQRCTTSDFRL
jgi:hypothetical protein